MVVGTSLPKWVSWSRLEKRSRALRPATSSAESGRNLTRDIQASGAPMVHPTPGRPDASGPSGVAVFPALGHRNHASKNPSLDIQKPYELRLRALEREEPLFCAFLRALPG